MCVKPVLYYFEMRQEFFGTKGLTKGRELDRVADPCEREFHLVFPCDLSPSRDQAKWHKSDKRDLYILEQARATETLTESIIDHHDSRN